MMGVTLALDIQAEVGRRTFGGRRLAFRIGINSGQGWRVSSAARSLAMTSGAGP
jgi:hypothetical protein